MKIGIVSQGFGYGGSYIAAANVGKALAATGHDLYYLAYQYPTNFSHVPDNRLIVFGQPHVGVKRYRDKAGKGIEMVFHHAFTPSRYMQAEATRLLRLIDQYQFDVVILNSFWSVTLFGKFLRERRPLLKTIGWMHEATDYSFGALTKNYRKAYVDGIKAVSQVVCLTATDQRRLRTYNPQTTVIYNPVALPDHGLADLSAQKIVFTTRLDLEIKGLDYLVDLANQLPAGWSVEVAGQGRPQQVADFEALLKAQADPQKIHFVGALSGQRLADHYQHGSIFISTSRTEGLPLVIIEAMSFGLPVVSFAHNGGREILMDGRYGKLVPIGDVTGMLKALSELMASEAQRREFQQLSLQRYEYFKLPIIVKAWEKTLQQLVN